MNPAAHGERSILVLGKAVVILDTLAESSPATLTLLTSTVGLNKSTVYRLLRTMVDLGLVEHLPSGGYRLGLRMLRYGEALRDGLELRRESLPYMAELANETGLATFLCIRRGDEAFCIERIAGKHVQLLVLVGICGRYGVRSVAFPGTHTNLSMVPPRLRNAAAKAPPVIQPTEKSRATTVT